MHANRIAGAMKRQFGRVLSRRAPLALQPSARVPVLRAAACAQRAAVTHSRPARGSDSSGTQAGDGPTVDWEAFRTQGKQLVDFICDYYQVASGGCVCSPLAVCDTNAPLSLLLRLRCARLVRPTEH